MLAKVSNDIQDKQDMITCILRICFYKEMILYFRIDIIIRHDNMFPSVVEQIDPKAPSFSSFLRNAIFGFKYDFDLLQTTLSKSTLKSIELAL